MTTIVGHTKWNGGLLTPKEANKQEIMSGSIVRKKGAMASLAWTQEHQFIRPKDIHMYSKV